MAQNPVSRNFRIRVLYFHAFLRMKAHTLKGVCATLGLTELSDKFSHIVEMVRHGEIDEVKLRACVEDAGNKLRHVLLLIQDL